MVPPTEQATFRNGEWQTSLAGKPGWRCAKRNQQGGAYGGLRLLIRRVADSLDRPRAIEIGHLIGRR